MKMKFKNGLTKVITLSYDDGVYQDIRLIEIMSRYGLKGTFNINAGLFFPEDGQREGSWGRLKLSEAVELYTKSGMEVAIHGLTHPFLEKLDSTEVIYEITEDRKQLEQAFGTIVRGMAYPFGTYSEEVVDLLDKCKVAYSRTTKATMRFGFPENWLTLHPTCHHNCENLDELIHNFIEKPSYQGNCEMFYLWGHSYEFDNNDNWNVIEKFAEYAGGHEDIWYATNIEIYNYVKAYESLETSYDKKIIHNPSAIDVWAEIKGNLYEIKAGETLKIN